MNGFRRDEETLARDTTHETLTLHISGGVRDRL